MQDCPQIQTLRGNPGGDKMNTHLQLLYNTMLNTQPLGYENIGFTPSLNGWGAINNKTLLYTVF